MKIRIKLLLLTISTFLLFGAAIVAYFAILSPIDTIQKESKTIMRVAYAASQLQIQTNRLMVDSFGMADISLIDSRKVWDDALKDLDAVTMLPNINDKLKEAITIIRNLRELSGPALAKLDSNFLEIKDLADKFLFGWNAVYYTKFFGYISSTPDHKLDSDSMKKVLKFAGSISSVNLTLDAVAGTLLEQDQVISAEIEVMKIQSTTISLAIVAAIMLGALLVSFAVARSIAIGLTEIGTMVNVMGTGDLRVRFSTKRRDETGALGSDLNNLLDAFHKSLGEIQQAAAKNVRIKDRLVLGVGTATSSSVEIEANSDAIKSRMVQLDGMIEQSTDKMRTMAVDVGNFNNKMEKQDQHIGNSVAAVTQMMASIGNVTRITEKDRQEAGELVKEAEYGKEVFDNAFAKVAEITESIGQIKEMAAVISGISTQTNILAMNAAIEAAHAGEFGKGFAVVADEIGKLAAASSTSSEEIARTIAEITVKINEADSTRNTTTLAFAAITKRIDTVSQSVLEIHRNVREMDEGSRQILEAMEELKAASSGITDDSREIEEGIQDVSNTIENIERISREVVSNIDEIAAGLQEISRTVHGASDQAGELGDIAGNLENAAQRFQIS